MQQPKLYIPRTINNQIILVFLLGFLCPYMSQWLVAKNSGILLYYLIEEVFSNFYGSKKNYKIRVSVQILSFCFNSLFPFALMPEVNTVFFHLLHFLCRKDSSVKPSLLHFLQDYLNTIN